MFHNQESYSLINIFYVSNKDICRHCILPTISKIESLHTHTQKKQKTKKKNKKKKKRKERKRKKKRVSSCEHASFMNATSISLIQICVKKMQVNQVCDVTKKKKKKIRYPFSSYHIKTKSFL